jgi:outer membrane protein assembly factor BamB
MGHDAARTSASKACVRGLRPSWSFTAPPHKDKPTKVTHAVADSGAVYVAAASGIVPLLYKLDAGGKLLWTFDSKADLPKDGWPLLALGHVVLYDDGIYLIDPGTGAERLRLIDHWGHVLTDGERFFLTNTVQMHGPGLFVGAFDRMAHELWKKNWFHGPHQNTDDHGGICLGESLVHANNYQRMPHRSSVTAYDPKNGRVRWTHPTIPTGPPSCGGDLVFVVERGQLVARKTSDGAVAFTRALPGIDDQPPVLAGDLVIVHGEAVTAMDRAGNVRWSAPLPRSKAFTLAAAMGSRTLVVASGKRLLLLDLDSGAERGKVDLEDEVHSPVIGDALYAVVGSTLRAF